MLRRSQTIELEEIVSSAAIDPTQWKVFSARVRELIPEVKVFMHVTDMTNEAMQPAFADGIGDGFLASFIEYYQHMNPWTAKNIQSPIMAPMWTERTVPASTLRGTEFFEDFLRHLGESDSASGIKLLQDRERFAQISFHYDSARAERTNAIVEPMMRALAPAMRGALEALRLNRADREQMHFGGFLQRLFHPALVLDKSGRVKSANRQMEALFESVRSIGIERDGKLKFAEPHLQSSLIELLSILAKPNEVSLPLKRLLPTLRTVVGNFQLTSTPMAANLSDFWGVDEQWATELVVLITLTPFASSHSEHVLLLRQTFGLTIAEAELCILLGRGIPLPVAAQRQGKTHETARSHLRSIFSKLRVAHQTELVVLLHRTLPGIL